MHIQNMSKTRVGSAKDVVKRGQEVWVKVISMQGQKISLSMRDVDQVLHSCSATSPESASPLVRPLTFPLSHPRPSSLERDLPQAMLSDRKTHAHAVLPWVLWGLNGEGS